jgi:hypothetical protein
MSTTPTKTHHAVCIAGRRSAIPFTAYAPAYALAKRALRAGDFAIALEVYEHQGKHYAADGVEVVLRPTV